MTASDLVTPAARGDGVSAAEFRHAMGQFATGMTVVTSVDAGGRPVGTTASAVSSLSLDPPRVLVCFDLASMTLRAVRSHGAFVLNVLAAPQQQLSANFARTGLSADWDGVTHRPGITGSPCLHGVLAVVECTVEHYLPGGDHEIVVGRVRAVETGDESASALLYWRRLLLRGSAIGLPDARTPGRRATTAGTKSPAPTSPEGYWSPVRTDVMRCVLNPSQCIRPI